MSEAKKTALLALVTFAEVFGAIFVGDNIFQVQDVEFVENAAISGLGAAASVLFNGVLKLRGWLENA